MDDETSYFMNRYTVISARAIIVQILHYNIVEAIRISSIPLNSQPDLVTQGTDLI